MRVIDEKLYNELMNLFKANQIQLLRKEYNPTSSKTLQTEWAVNNKADSLPPEVENSAGESQTEDVHETEKPTVEQGTKSEDIRLSSSVAVEVPEPANAIPSGWKPVTLAENLKRFSRKPTSKRKVALLRKKKTKRKAVPKKRR